MTQGSVCGLWMRRLIALTVAVAVCVAFVESMTRGGSGLSALVFASTTPSDRGTTSGSLVGHRQRSGGAERVRGNDDGYVEGLAATLGYRSPELMATGSIGSAHTMAQR